MDQFDDKLNKHIDKVLELQRQKESKPLTLQELKEVDLSLGMTEEDWNAMMQKVEDYVQMANSHMQYGNYIEAFKAAESAVSINPYHQQALLLMAGSSLGKYESDQKDEFLFKAQESANELLKVNPKQQSAIQILSKVRSYLKSENTQKKNILIYGGIGLVVIVLIAGYFVLRPTPAPKENTELKNQLIESEEGANAAWAQVENMIARRDHLIPQLLELAPESNSEATNLKSEVDDLKKRLETATGVDEKMELNNQLQEKLILLTNSINSGSSNKKTELILVQIEGSYNRISVEAKRYNDAVRNYNVMVKKFGNQFPEFKEKPYFLGK